MADSFGTIQFRRDWTQAQSGAIERGGRLRVDYDKERLPRCFATFRGAEFGAIVAYIRFHPRGELFSAPVLAPVRSQPGGMVVGHSPVPFELSVPGNATQAEIWFHNFYQTTSRCDAWDSRFGENYWFSIGGVPPQMPAQPVAFRRGALVRPDIVNVLEHSASKANVFPTPTDGWRQYGVDLQTSLKVVAWVKESAYGANAWIDVHVFDGDGGLIHADTLTLLYGNSDSAFRYEFSGKIYQGATATPGSVQYRPGSRKVQFRIYYDVYYQVFTDGILHQHELQDDGETR